MGDAALLAAQVDSTVSAVIEHCDNPRDIQVHVSLLAAALKALFTHGISQQVKVGDDNNKEHTTDSSLWQQIVLIADRCKSSPEGDTLSNSIAAVVAIVPSQAVPTSLNDSDRWELWVSCGVQRGELGRWMKAVVESGLGEGAESGNRPRTVANLQWMDKVLCRLDDKSLTLDLLRIAEKLLHNQLLRHQLKTGDALLDQGNYQSALEEYKRVAQSFPDSPVPPSLQAVCHLSLQQPTQALTAAEHSCALQPTLLTTFLRLTEVLLQLECRQLLRQCVHHALSLYPHSPSLTTLQHKVMSRHTTVPLTPEILRGNPWLRRLPNISPDEPVERLGVVLAHKYPGEFSFALSFEESFVEELLYFGFLTMSERVGDLEWVLLPKLHVHRCILEFPKLHIQKKVKQRSKHFTLSVDNCFERVLQRCIAEHGSGWLSPPLVACFTRMYRHKHHDSKVHFHSFELWRGSELVAGEVGYVVGRCYSSISGFHTIASSGSVQCCAAAIHLQRQGFLFWDLGMELPYKLDLGAHSIPRLEFLQRLLGAKQQPPSPLVCDMQPAGELVKAGLGDTWEVEGSGPPSSMEGS